MSSHELVTVIQTIKSFVSKKTPVVIALDGKSGVGKSTLAKQLGDACNATIVEQDDFYTGGSLSEWSGRSAAENARRVIDWSRIRREALGPLLHQKIARYHPFHWNTLGGIDTHKFVTCEPKDVIILEGVYSAGPWLTDLVDIKVLIKLDESERLKRLQNREGEEFVMNWHEIWHNAEEYYFKKICSEDKFDIIIERH